MSDDAREKIPMNWQNLLVFVAVCKAAIGGAGAALALLGAYNVAVAITAHEWLVQVHHAYTLDAFAIGGGVVGAILTAYRGVRKAADEITRLRADLAAVTAERDYVMAEGLFSADQIRILRAERDTAIAERDAAIEERDYVMAEGLFRDEQNEDLRKTVSKIWEQLGNPTYKELNGRTIHDLIDSVIYERNNIAARLREENERLREAFEKAANDMRPMLRSLISRNEAEEIVRRAARAALEGVTEPQQSGEGNE